MHIMYEIIESFPFTCVDLLYFVFVLIPNHYLIFAVLTPFWNIHFRDPKLSFSRDFLS